MRVLVWSFSIEILYFFREMINHCNATAYQLTPRVLFPEPCEMLHDAMHARY